MSPVIQNFINFQGYFQEVTDVCVCMCLHVCVKAMNSKFNLASNQCLC